MTFLIQMAIFLAAAVIAVPVFRRLGLGAVLGYLAAGVAVGPQGSDWPAMSTASCISPNSGWCCCCS